MVSPSVLRLALSILRLILSALLIEIFLIVSPQFAFILFKNYPFSLDQGVVTHNELTIILKRSTCPLSFKYYPEPS